MGYRRCCSQSARSPATPTQTNPSSRRSPGFSKQTRRSTPSWRGSGPENTECEFFCLSISGEVLRVGAGVDQKIRNVNLAPSRPSLTRATYAQHPYPTISSISKIMRTIESKSRDIKTHQFDVQRPHTHSFFSENSPNLIIDAKR